MKTWKSEGYKKLEEELIGYIKLGKRTGNMALRNAARKALSGLEGDDGTPGLDTELWEHEVMPNLTEARTLANYIEQTQNAVNVAIALGNRRRAMMAR